MNKSSQRRRRACAVRRQGFTLVELLAVIAIIMLLVGMILSGISAVRNAARKAKARGDIIALEHAVKAYVNDNGKLPIPPSVQGQIEPAYFAENAASAEIVEALTTTNNTGIVENPRGIVYLDPQNNASPGIYRDPWGTPYAFKFDADYNSLVAYPDGTPENIPAPVVVISYGPNRKRDSAAGGDDLVSEAWKTRSAGGR